ncbi:F-box only protein 40 isoform X2 [Astyanax mexicanus]|uniref:F-box only protein 40 isoform X2 n=1 Tax=Astyanax mexicanus TaxID=7994 RepID=UPI0020CB4E32|nr:F-box only protein 40 isoform X2 [Astyanax mexicanus]
MVNGRNKTSNSGLHKHCEKCFNQHCKVSVEISTSCVVISCRLQCGAAFHLCKEDEHNLLCPKVTVPCLNAQYGCPMSMPRHRLAQHLESCPASVVCCSLEWNRWPVSETDSNFYNNAVQEPNCMEQLDLAMAFRDQKLLFNSIKMSTLFPELTQQRLEDPENQELDGAIGGVDSGEWKDKVLSEDDLNLDSVPEVQELTQEERLALAKSKDVACLENYSMWEGMFKKEMEGCKQTVKNLDQKSDKNQKKQSQSDNKDMTQGPKDAQESNSLTEVDFSKTGFAPWQDGVLERLRKEVNVAEYNMYLVHNGCMLINFGQLEACTPKEKDFVYGNLEPIEVQTIHAFNVPKSYTAKRMHLKDPSHGAKKTDQSVDTSDLGVSIEDLPKSDEVQTTLLCCLERELKGHQISETVGIDGLYVDLGTQTYDFPSTPFSPDASLAEITAELKPPNLHLQIQTECVTRRHNKASSAFTYLCCHTFRRDEFPWHFRNVHSDVQSCLTGWLIQRCPLAYLGCTYSQNQFRPSKYQATVSYDQDLGTFALQPHVAASLYTGVKTESSERKRPRNLDSLSRLPFEILQHIARFLDSMSLCQLSLVSQLMREVCGTLLQQRGMVSLKWEKKIYSHGGSCWKARKKVWEFSSLFSPVEKWVIDDVPSMAEHLKICPYYQTHSRTEPVALPSLNEFTDRPENTHSLLTHFLHRPHGTEPEY